MQNAHALFKRVYQESASIEICIAELKRYGYSYLETIRVLMDVAAIDLVRADYLVMNSVAWYN
ncbi:hypothetical protein [Spirosoma endophyticum]|uniref:Uncharacterized protein n=1 Tax=Spirosoma endophyticum TaxID=662367 RepID=A0A1I2E9F5_9BACT|nr:hypothetical protein [Spirosoma endophyticum]SFE89128.1 hypothetical protein SAMN05216167_12163 [Spirosoma endophyticum]